MLDGGDPVGNFGGSGCTYKYEEKSYLPESLWRRLPCPDYGVELTAGSIMDHRRRLHGKEPAIDWDRLPVSHMVHPPEVFEVSFPKVTTKCQCPFPGLSRSSCTWSVLRNHSNWQHWWDSLLILEEHPLHFPRCEQCGRQVLPWIISNRKYTS